MISIIAADQINDLTSVAADLFCWKMIIINQSANQFAATVFYEV